MISSAQDADAMAGAMCSASLSVMIVTESFGTDEPTQAMQDAKCKRQTLRVHPNPRDFAS
jgi:hypothetical protein